MLALPKIMLKYGNKMERKRFSNNILHSFLVPKWCPVLQNHLVRRYGKINDDMRKTLILSHFLMVS
ncbi:hypothetical protein C7256_27260 [Enterocloster lavalensis]|nr:hypothetical protein C7256_27260 [Enterocloster lavalensis]